MSRSCRRSQLVQDDPALPAQVSGMTPFIVLTLALLVFLGLSRLRPRWLPDWVTSLRWALAVMFMLTASAHWGSRRADLVAMVPDAMPDPELLVTISGIAEIAGAVGLLVPRLAPFAAAGLALLLVAVFPANVHAARESLSIGGAKVTPLIPRALLQVVFLGAVLVAGFWQRGVGRVQARRGAAPREPA
jgi:uncharacterized membrane protein